MRSGFFFLYIVSQYLKGEYQSVKVGLGFLYDPSLNWYCPRPRVKAENLDPSADSPMHKRNWVT